MKDPTNTRKLEHISIIHADQDVDRKKNYFDLIRLRHRALPEVALQDVDTSMIFMDKKLSFPLLISSMTGGDNEMILKINRNLAKAAELTQVAMAVGSQRVMFSYPKARASFALRQVAPSTLLFANIGAVQLNYDFSVLQCQQAIEVLKADGIFFHLNPLQEAVQPEGDTNFHNLAEKIGQIAKQLPIPVILKEVGAGLSEADVQLGMKHGIRYFDIAGAGGTSWSRIEHHRQVGEHISELGVLFQDWGNPTPMTLKRLQPYRDQVTLIASGGIRSGIDMVKAVILGASLCGLAKPFLKPAMESVECVVRAIEELQRQFKVAMFLLGIPRIQELYGNTELVLNADFRY